MKLAITFFIISSIVALGECIKCFSCKNSSLSAAEEYKICGEQFIMEDMDSCNGKYCLKIVAKSSNNTFSETNVRRLCTDTLSNLGHTISGKIRKTRSSMHTESANFYYCDTDLCNSSTNLSIFIILLFISFINFIF
ncbi:uncharacterized protein LOC122510484 [Leptopilina heterotoma]|uniref:uncharacterized protein LOC122510484 n=1 Tax=Leptopilina heterotoma TaxID=63436 RepID=UPI001CA94C2A|nr:uncharacterized protein LOC122510484 [Leptopilina heterotoma]